MLLGLAAFAAPVHAQNSENEDAPIEAADAEEGEGTIVITGSRIRRAGFDTLEPAVVVSDEYLETRGLTNVADALNEIPSFGVGVTPEGGQPAFSVGQNFVSRFGLGSARTLTLLNGRRFVSTNVPSIFGSGAPGLQVDLNIFPSELVDRIENIAIGGAPTYGSDAIAGTVNVIFKTDFEGLHASVTSGITERGDNFRVNASLLGGVNFGGGQGNVTLALSYDRAEGVLGVERPMFRDFLQTGTNPICGSAQANIPGRTPATDGRVSPDVPCNGGATDGIPNSVFIRDTRIFSLTEGGLLYPLTGAFNNAAGVPNGFGPGGNTRLQFDTNGNLIPYNPGFPFGTQNGSGGDGFSIAGAQQLTADLERYTAFLTARYDVTDNVRLFVEGTLYRAYATELSDQPIFNATLFGGVSQVLTFSATDPRLSPQARTQLAALGVTDFRLSRASTDLVVNNSSSRTDVYRGVVGLEGNFDIAGAGVFWEATANIGESKGYFDATALNQQNFVNAINVRTNAQGQIVCDPTPARNVAPGGINPVVDPQCVPLDVFGRGRASAAALEYVTDRTRAISTLRQQVYNVNASSNLFDLWGAGPVGVAVGYEHRYEFGGFEPDEFQRLGRGRSVPIGANEGSFNTDEVFGELLIPLVSPQNDIPLIYSAQMEGKARYVHNTVNGGFTAYTVGGRLSPVRDIQFRGNYTRSLRAPSVTELFTPLSPAFNFFPDPCDRANIAQGPNPTVRRRNCDAFYQSYGIVNGATTFDSQARVATIPVVTGGDPNLENEEGRAYTFGVVLQPSFIPRFRAAVDWNRIRITGNIAALTPANIAEGCYDNPDFDLNDPDNGNTFCTLFTRVRGGPNNGQLVNDPANPGLRGIFVNGAFIEFKGLTAEVNYNFPLDGLGLNGGRIDLSALYFYTHRLRLSNNAVTIDPNQGELASPRHAGQFNIGFSYNDFGIDLQANYTGEAKLNNLNTADSLDILKVEDVLILNTSFRWRIKDETFFRFTVSNLTDQLAPFPLSTQAFGIYDMLGRRFTVSLDYRF
ncbi:TonB-dependent receptor [Sphingosinicella sp. LHD-64]|uniref:TonB-dependent receptor domain-containing protein n=1 Tax=Sphingosinicella sp. LHD-64 TaxID=3072139 RepID=UPI00280CF0C3|nr:TonB-dependent receptor [Sphingosinicella sp. LHD-64]MDQ8756210.1 TonB-dependent receptor [Sphingosinicella sp. LHD-64]